MKSYKDPNHIGTKHPFQGNGKTPAPKTGKGAGTHKTAAGDVKKFATANASMKRK